MTKFKHAVRLLTIAEIDIDEIIEYIRADNISASIIVKEKIFHVLRKLEDSPQLGRIPDNVELQNIGYRYIIVLDYLIFYKIEGRTVLVYRVVHGARNYRSLLL